MRILIFGSLAYDRIMSFPGKFQDHILPDKLHILNVCFLVEGLKEYYGGTAGNIAYNLAMLGDSPLIQSAAGKDFDNYTSWLREKGLSIEGIRFVDSEFTAGAYITTDKSDNQITGFNPGAMKYTCDFDFNRLGAEEAIGIISPGNAQDMQDLPRTYKELGIPYIFDPGQQITALGGPAMAEAIDGALMLVTNDYELEMVMKDTGKTRDELLEMTPTIITTLGEKGCRIVTKDGEVEVGAAEADVVNDPTGAGDAFRSGLLFGLKKGMALPECCKLGATAASFCVEKQGTQEHSFTLETFNARLKKYFDMTIQG